jgi:hypothetical protein
MIFHGTTPLPLADDQHDRTQVTGDQGPAFDEAAIEPNGTENGTFRAVENPVENPVENQ